MTLEILDWILKVIYVGIGLQVFFLIRSIRKSVNRFWEKIGYRLELAAEELRKAIDTIEDMARRGDKLSSDAEYDIRSNGMIKSILKLFI